MGAGGMVQTHADAAPQAPRRANRLEAIGRLTSGIAHDFNNLLSVVLLNGESLLQALPPDAEVRAGAEDMIEAARHAASLSRHLLSLSRCDDAAAGTVDVNARISALGPLLRRMLPENIELTTAETRGVGLARVDPAELDQIVVNLVVNARDAMPLGGRLRLATGTGCDHGGPHVTLTVSDTGYGTEGEPREHISERGSGLGLTTCRLIAEARGGRIGVTSEPGRGSVFTVFLPQADAPGPPRSGVRPVPPFEPGGRETIFLVEDDDAVRELVRRIVLRLGYQVIAARNGEDALGTIDSHDGAVHLVLADVIMPGMSGPEVFAAIQQRHPSSKVLYMSGHPRHRLASAPASERMPFDSLQKPFTSEALARKLRDVLDA